MPLMEPRSPWASTHGEKTGIPNRRIDLAEFGIGKLLSCGRLTSNTRANSPVPFLLGTNLTRLQEQVKLKGCSQCARSACAGFHGPIPSNRRGLIRNSRRWIIGRVLSGNSMWQSQLHHGRRVSLLAGDRVGI